MPLLGWPLVVSLGLMLVVVTVGVLLLWNRVRGPGALRVVQRIGMLVLVQASCTALVAAGVNNYGYFFGSWSDLVGGGGGVGQVQHVGGASGLVGPGLGSLGPSTAIGEPLTTWSTPAAYASRGEVLQTYLSGSRTRLDAAADIYLPPQYFQPAYKKSEFPAVEVFSGYPGSTNELVSSLDYPGVLLKEIDAHKAGPMILVMLDPAVDMPRDTECTDVPGGPQVLTFVSEDVPIAVRRIVRARPTRWGVMGHSTGGFCATKVAMTHPDLFPAAVSMSGYYHATTDETTGDLFGGSTSFKDLNDPEWLLGHLPEPRISLLASIGGAEGGAQGLTDTHHFVSLVRSPMSADVIVVPHGAHNFADIRQVLPVAVQWLWRHLIG